MRFFILLIALVCLPGLLLAEENKNGYKLGELNKAIDGMIEEGSEDCRVTIQPISLDEDEFTYGPKGSESVVYYKHLDLRFRVICVGKKVNIAQ